MKVFMVVEYYPSGPGKYKLFDTFDNAKEYMIAVANSSAYAGTPAIIEHDSARVPYGKSFDISEHVIHSEQQGEKE